MKKYLKNEENKEKNAEEKKLSEAEIYDKLAKDFGLKQETVFDLLNPRYGGYKGFASYTLSNNNQNINRLKKRLKSLQALEKMQTKEFEFDFLGFYYHYQYWRRKGNK